MDGVREVQAIDEAILREIAERKVRHPWLPKHMHAHYEECVLMRFGLAYRKRVDPERLLPNSRAQQLFSIKGWASFEPEPIPLHQIFCMTDDEAKSLVRREKAERKLDQHYERTGISVMPQWSDLMGE
jgi:hypothetical protein